MEGMKVFGKIQNSVNSLISINGKIIFIKVLMNDFFLNKKNEIRCHRIALNP